MLSLTCKTALKAVILLASRSEQDQKIGMREIAEQIEASEHTVGKLLQILVKEGVINSMKGPTGGFYVTPAQKKQPILQVIEAIDGKDVFRQCGLGLSKCSGTHPCPIHDDYKEVRDRFERMCRERRIMELCEPVSSGDTYLF